MHPTAVSERAARVVALRRELQASAPDLWAPSELAQEGAPVLSVILGEADEPFFVGVHTHQSYEEEGEGEMEIERWREREGGREGVHARYTPDTHKVHIRSHTLPAPACQTVTIGTR